MANIRCIDTKTGKIRFIPEHLTKDLQVMGQYNLIVQDNTVKEKEMFEAVAPVIEPIIKEEPQVEPLEVKETKKKFKPNTQK